MGPLNRSLSLSMDEFYNTLKTVGVSAITGDGMANLFEKIDEAGVEYRETFLPDIVRRIEEREKADEKKREKSMEKLKQDMADVKV